MTVSVTYLCNIYLKQFSYLVRSNFKFVDLKNSVFTLEVKIQQVRMASLGIVSALLCFLAVSGYKLSPGEFNFLTFLFFLDFFFF